MSTGITYNLPPAAEWVLMALMFLGRIGTVTVASALALSHGRGCTGSRRNAPSSARPGSFLMGGAVAGISRWESVVEMSTTPERDLLLELQDLIVGTESVAEFLGGFASIAAGVFGRSANETVECGVTLKRIKRTATVGGSGPKAIHLDQIEQRVGDGPCIAALKTGAPTLLGDVRTDPRWPEYQKVLYDEGILSALGVPLQLGKTPPRP